MKVFKDQFVLSFRPETRFTYYVRGHFSNGDDDPDYSIFYFAISFFVFLFLGAIKHLFNWLSLLVGRLVCLSVTHSFDDQHVAPFWPTWPCYYEYVTKDVFHIAVEKFISADFRLDRVLSH